MASNSKTSEIVCEGPELRRLGFMRSIAIGVFICASNLYDYAKQNHGLLTFPARIVEVPARIVLGPVCNRFRNLTDDLLVIADTLVDEADRTINAYAPTSVKRLVRRVKVVANKVIDKAVAAANEARTGGPGAAARYAAEESKKCLLKTTAKLWVYFSKYLVIRALAYLLLPGAAYFSNKYNDCIRYTTGRGYPFVGYLPAIPLNELTKAVNLESRKYYLRIPPASIDIPESSRSHSD
ncbi:REF/SRPP-like protein At1g67360 [Prosopis cineraria]|uniref:REF/SRPP-like protein At1g67360 n=1 Tax=Prosopis cineraria TaxID=364024 RepID=UPI00240F6DC6|nr:REF/SRPP-like protein At1g67360 [Prosopis cineraria]